MANGFFLGGVADAMEGRAKRDLAEQELLQNKSLRERALSLQERELGRHERMDVIKLGEERIADTMKTVSDVVRSAIAAGKDPAKALSTVQPLLDQAKQIAGGIGRDPRALDAQVAALTIGPTADEAAAAAGRAAGVKGAAESATTQREMARYAAEQGQGKGGEIATSYILDPTKREEVTSKLRDDYQKAGKDFGIVRDFHDRMQVAPKDGAGDIAVVFSYMKILDPTSTVREGEYATAANSGGAYSVIGNLYNKLVDGQQLPPAAREKIVNAATKIWEQSNKKYSKLTNDFAAIAKRRGIDPRDILIDPDEQGAPAVADAPITTPGGVTFRPVAPARTVP